MVLELLGLLLVVLLLVLLELLRLLLKAAAGGSVAAAPARLAIVQFCVFGRAGGTGAVPWYLIALSISYSNRALGHLDCGTRWCEMRPLYGGAARLRHAPR